MSTISVQSIGPSQTETDDTIKAMNVLKPGGNQSLTPAFRGKVVTLAILFQICCGVWEYVAVGTADHDI